MRPLCSQKEVTPDGLEKTFAVNHLAPFALTHLLLDLLRAAPAGRILTASLEFHSGELDFSNLQGQRQYNWLGAYKRSKLCNILFTYELSRRLAGTTLTANCFSPGPTLTRLGDNMRGLHVALPWLLKRIPFACIAGTRSENARLCRVLTRPRRCLRQILPAVPRDAHQTDYVRQRRRSQALEHESSAV
jgi:NAD(P)-dependent dehydrogenase (short-subunit alcohol dehydrogenase family)